MLFERIYDEDLAQASYFIGCQANGTAVVVDPRRDIGVYLETARRRGMQIVAVTETHIHADYLSGARELAQATGASLYLSDEGGADWQYGFPHEGLRDGEGFSVGNIELRAVHTPGHTPEHICFLITDGAASDQPGYLLTGDFVFVGDLGRPDLLDEAAGGSDTRGPMARELFASLRERFWTLPDYVQVWPGHGAGSACGKSLGAVPSSTVGYEKLTAWWSRFVAVCDEEGFVAELLEGQPDAPRYFGRMKHQNRDGPALLGELPELEQLQPGRIPERIRAGAQVIDVRPRRDFTAGAVPGTINVPAGKAFAKYAAWVIDPEEDNSEVILLGADREQALELRNRLLRVGVDDVRGFATGLGDLETQPVPGVAPEDLGNLSDPFILDVRSASEYDDGHVPGAVNIHGGRLLWQLDSVPRDRPVVIYCQSGARSGVVGSALLAKGFDNLIELEGSYAGWQRRAGEPAAS